ncbi:hypothetical protein SASPL_142058 [Salvia splendens]|uniref:NPH3 domain-containing protein n=1 Tax=Salvia splendens TaxID=180675 RepID=A0A8X8WIH6_SALSN|nr:hypothetical protein SASPL_142058 [Salvia splendens]
MDVEANMSTKKKDLLSTAMKRTSDWIFSQEIPSDVTVTVAGTSFSLHKLVSDSSDTAVSAVDIPGVPGGADAFELAAKFCYGINFEITTENIAMLRCVAEHLEMTEDYAVGNLVARSEAYINEVALESLAGAVSVLHSSEDLLPTAEKVKLISRCIDTVAFVACKDSQFTSPDPGAASSAPPAVDWWAEDLTVLRVDLFQRVLIAMMGRGFKQYALGPILMLYAQKSLRGLDIFGKGRKKIEARQEHEKRVVLETIVSLLPRERNAMSVSFLSMLLRAAIFLETTVACRLDLEKRVAMQLSQAVLDDLLIPSYSFTGDTIFDVETLQRIVVNFLEAETEEETAAAQHIPEELERVTKLMEDYLSEIASDRNLSVSKFTSLAELIPEHSRSTEDGMYRAIDIYLKAHPALSDMERKKVCSVMDCQKLSREACAHAAQNDRLPVQTVVQVLYYEQQRLRQVMDGGLSESPALQPKLPSYTVSDELSILRRENQDLKLEVVKLKMRMKETDRASQKPATATGTATSSPSADKPPLAPKKSFISSVSKRLGKIMRVDGLTAQGSKGRTKPNKDRRHSIS